MNLINQKHGTTVKTTEFIENDIDSEFSVLFHTSNIPQEATQHHNHLNNSGNSGVHHGQYHGNMSSTNDQQLFEINNQNVNKLKRLPKNSVSDWAAKGLDPTDLFVQQQIKQGGNHEKQLNDYFYENDNPDSSINHSHGSDHNGIVVGGGDSDSIVSQEERNIYGENYLHDHDYGTNRSGLSSPPNRSGPLSVSCNQSSGESVFIQKLREQTFPTDEKKIKRNRGTFNHQRKTNNYTQNNNNSNNLNLNIQSYKPPLMRKQVYHNHLKQQKTNFHHQQQQQYRDNNFQSNELGQDSISDFMNEHDRSNMMKPDNYVFAAYLGPISSSSAPSSAPSQSSLVHDKASDLSILSNTSQPVLHTVRIATNTENHSQHHSQQSSISIHGDSSSSSLSISPYPDVAFGSRVNQVEVDSSSSSDCYRHSLGKLKSLQGDVHSNLSLEEAEEFAQSYHEWMVSEVNSKIPLITTTHQSFPPPSLSPSLSLSSTSKEENMEEIRKEKQETQEEEEEVSLITTGENDKAMSASTIPNLIETNKSLTNASTTSLEQERIVPIVSSQPRPSKLRLGKRSSSATS